jgi:DNA-binding transcriptional ArsR family regulator
MQPAAPDIEPFEAIRSPVRRQILDILVEGERPVNDIVGHFEMSRPAISQHLRILLAAGLVAQQRHGREQHYRLVPENLAPVRDWIAHYERFWDAHFKRLRHYLDKRSAAGAASKRTPK